MYQSQEHSRTEYTIKNMYTGIFVQVLSLLLGFISRKVLIDTLGNEYLSLNGLFSEILTILSLAELGFGSAIVFSLYKPIAFNDGEKIKSLLHLYKKTYRIIALIIFAFGIAILPFIKIIIKREPDISENIHFIFLLFLLNSVFSYFFAYRRSILIAHQKNYLISRVNLVTNITLTIVQISILVLFKNFILYFIATIIANVGSNYYISRLSGKLFPVIKEKDIKPLDEDIKDDIKINIKSLVLYKIGALLNTGFDNIIISFFVDFTFVGIYSNYLLITKGVNNLLSTIFQSTTASVGNLNALEDSDKREQIYKTLLFISFWLYGFVNIAFFNLLNPLIKLVFGEYYLFSEDIVFVMIISGFIIGLHHPTMIFRNTMGLYRYGKWRPIIGAFINIALSVLLVRPFGIIGVFLGTLGSRILVLSWFEPRVIYKYGLHKTPKYFYYDYIKYILIFLLTAAISKIAVNQIHNESIVAFCVKVLITAIIPNILFFIICYRSKYYVYVKDIGVSVVKRYLKRKGKNENS